MFRYLLNLLAVFKIVTFFDHFKIYSQIAEIISVLKLNPQKQHSGTLLHYAQTSCSR